jgi:hypothetical protein
MRNRMVALAVVLMAAVFLTAWAWPDSTEKPFASGGRIELQLEGGDYEISAATTDVIRVSLSGNTGDTKVVLNTSGGHADLKISDTPHNDFHATIEVPAKSDLYVRLTAGNLNISTIEGNKDIESHAGNVELRIGDPSDYGNVDGSVRAGNVDARPFHVSKSGLFRSFKWSGPGKYTLHAHLGAGNLELHR